MDVAIVGAGAAGLMTAICTARRVPGVRVVALDGAARLGAKILVAGGGRCNVTNCTVTPADFNGARSAIVNRVLAAFPVDRTIAFFREIGVDLHEEAHGKLFPDSNRARTVLDAVLGEADRCGVALLTDWRVTNIERGAEGFVVVGADHQLAATRVVLATGGQSLPKSGSDGGGYALARQLGHGIVPTTPALEPLRLEGEFHAGLAGVSQEVEITVHVDGGKPIHNRGSLLWTHFGVSGPVVLDISRHWHRARLEGRRVEVRCSFLPGDDFVAVERRLLGISADRPKVVVHKALAGWMPARVAEALCHTLGVDARIPLGQLPREARRRLVHGLVEWPLPVCGGRGYNYAEATAGGVPLSEVDAGLASRKCAGLYLVGEILDVDGRIGGFNFQWAWSSGWVAAGTIAGSMA